MKAKFEINIQNDSQYKLRLQQLKPRIKEVLSWLQQESCCLNIRFCSTEEITEVNFQYRKKNKPTDVLSFSPTFLDQKQNPETSSFELGDLLVCIDVCKLQAKKFRVSLSQELEKMILHGILHLKGFDHERSESAHNIMNFIEKKLNTELVKTHGEAQWAEG